jgi:hypothetical protein
MHTAVCTNSGCDWKRTKPNQTKAALALKMHVARVHDKTIVTPSGPRASKVLAKTENEGNVLVAKGNRQYHPRRMSKEDSQSIVDFIVANRENFPSKKACFIAAMENAGTTGKITNNSTCVDRYFKKADALSNGHVNGNGATSTKRKYTKRNLVVEEQQNHAHDTLLKRCPRCGLVQDGAEEMLQLLQENPEVVHLALAAARKMMARKTANT